VDNAREAGICPHCGMAFITEKAITNYNNYIQNTVNMQGANIGNLTIQGGPNLEALLKRARVEIENGNFQAAAATCDKISDIDIDNSELWFYRLLLEVGVGDLNDLSNLHKDLTNSGTYKKALQLADQTKKEAMQKAVESAKHLSYFEMEGAALRKYTGPGGDVVIPYGVEIIGFDTDVSGRREGAFHRRMDIKSIAIPDSVTQIGNIGLSAPPFWYCTGINNIIIPDSVNYVMLYTFAGWNKTQTIYVNKRQSKKWDRHWDNDCKAKIVYR